MSKLTPRAALTACASHVREVYGHEPAVLIEVWRDRHLAVVPAPAKHRWIYIRQVVNGRWVERSCRSCRMVEDFAPLADGGREVARYVLADGTAVQKSKCKIPPCNPLSAGALSTRNPKEQDR